MAYYSLEPWGPERADLNAGIVASTLANIHRDPKRGQPFKPSDFMPKYGEDESERPDPMDPRVVKAKLVAAFGGRVKQKAKNGAV